MMVQFGLCSGKIPLQFLHQFHQIATSLVMATTMCQVTVSVPTRLCGSAKSCLLAYNALQLSLPPLARIRLGV